MKNLRNNLMKGGVALAMAFGLLVLTGVTANAQYNNDDYYRRQRQEQRDREREQRERDRQNQQNNGGYNNGGYGNNGGYNNGGYNNGGYNNGGYGNGGYNNGGNFRAARENGFRDGQSVGADDGQQRKSYSPERSHYYKSATNGYDNRSGSKDRYKDAYRQAFEQGYRRGYDQYNSRGRNNRNRGW